MSIRENLEMSQCLFCYNYLTLFASGDISLPLSSSFFQVVGNRKLLFCCFFSLYKTINFNINFIKLSPWNWDFLEREEAVNIFEMLLNSKSNLSEHSNLVIFSYCKINVWPYLKFKFKKYQVQWMLHFSIFIWQQIFKSINFNIYISEQLSWVVN